MQILDVIENAQSGQALANLARTFGIEEQAARAVTNKVMPELALGLERNTLSRGGLADVVGALGDGHHEIILDDPRAWVDPRVAADGQAILSHILGSEYKSRALAARAAQATGLSGSIVEALLPILAQMLMGAISRYMKGGLGDVLSKLPIPGGSGGGSERGGGINWPTHETGGTMPQDRQSGGQSGGFEWPTGDTKPPGGFPMPPIPGGQESGGDDRPYQSPVPQRRAPEERGSERGGWPWPNPGDPRDVWGNQPRRRDEQADQQTPDSGLPQSAPPAGGYPMPPMPPNPDSGGYSGPGNSSGGGFPLPGPGGGSRDNPYGDLSDILRRRGASVPGEQASGGGLWSIVRNVLGGALGFGGSGFFGWIVRLLVMRLGWPLLRRIIFGR